MGIITCAAVGLLLGVQADPAGIAFFEKRVRPVLVERCYGCHSAGAKKIKGKLTLDTRAGVLRGGNSGPVIVAGNPDKSVLIRAIPAGRPGEPDEVGALVAFLCSEQAGYITGTSVLIDGGLTRAL